MKKNRMMRLASGLLVAVLITTSTISGTYAKYVTEASVQDSARVAKFGVVVTATAESVFGKTYLNTTDDTPGDGTEADDAVTVRANEEVVAPGTKGTLAAFTITGTPEVDTVVTYEATVDLGDKWVDADDNYYCPLIIDGVNGLDYNTIDEFETAVKAAIEAHDDAAYYEAGTVLDTDALTFDVEWEWPFESADTDSDGKPDNDVKDTHLGDEAAEGRAATIDITVKCVVTQVD